MADGSAMPPFARAFRVILWGAIFAVFDVTVDGVDLLPDVLGHVLIGMGCIAGLPHMAELQPVGRASAWMLAGATVLGLSCDALELVSPGATWEFRSLIGFSESFTVLAFVALGRSVVGAWLPRHVKRWQIALVTWSILMVTHFVTWMGGQALEQGWQSPGVGWVLAAPLAFGVFVVGIVWFIVMLWSIFSTLGAIKRVRADAPRAVQPAA